MAGFPKLIPAFTVQVAIEPPKAISSSLTVVPFLSTGGTIVSEPSYPIKLDAAIEHGADYIKAAPDGRHVRLDVQSTARDAATGSLLRFMYRGKIATTGDAGRVLRGEENAGTTDFGEAFSIVEFEVGSKELAALEEKVYVGSGRFVFEPGKPTIVEYKVSEVAA
ncbi:hypothetical protein MYCTH_2294805 [Thermothelomyces thermophilus ATCC 42464]|uniref:Uncharacterized protein n=1 Tax=Thermothelomyces thermophilus (strain ATCC 42464 / BCRC 31852 / DSM 1799) TaxID=573729 RepID=G2Q2P0_THET4|nr:uncharacterized protein MYCTH_2294805 [Thermothelomyces thermophilus ATCC 42464]AEO53459.1 hypothetical protein MYCTH_2294805 [Thermothelomyces thermophilus ATCC 42464]